jgi:hypothetical protein
MEARDGACEINGNPTPMRRRGDLYQAVVVGLFCAHGLILGKRQRTEGTTPGGLRLPSHLTPPERIGSRCHTRPRTQFVWKQTDADSFSAGCQDDGSTGNSRGSFAVHRNLSATLSPTELASLRRVSIGLIKTVPSAHRDLFIIMTLAAVDNSGGLVVTEVGERRLQSEGRAPWRGTPASNLFDPPPRAVSKKPSKLVRQIVQAAHDMTKHRPIVWWVSVHDVTQHLGIEPRRVCRRLFRLSHAAIAGWSSVA